MRWFRLYEEVLNDPKVQSLPPDLFKFWINVLCVSSMCDGKLPSHVTLAFHFRASQEAVKFNLEKLIEASLIVKKGNFLTPYNWLGRQYKSDSSTERTRTWRNKNKAVTVTSHVTSQERHKDRHGDAPETETETETEKQEKEKQEKEKAALFPSGKPDPASVFSDQKAERLRQKAQRREQAVEILNFLNEKAGRAYRPKDATLRPIIARLEDGATTKQCRQIIAKKHHEWKDKEGMAEYLRPKTLFGATNFEQYVGELIVVEEESDVR